MKKLRSEFDARRPMRGTTDIDVADIWNRRKRPSALGPEPTGLGKSAGFCEKKAAYCRNERTADEGCRAVEEVSAYLDSLFRRK